MELLLGLIFGFIVICIIAVAGARVAYSTAYDDYERDVMRTAREMAEDAEVETRIVIEVIDERSEV